MASKSSSASPLSLLKSARSLIKKHGCKFSRDEDVIQQLRQCIAGLESEPSAEAPPSEVCTYNLDLGLDDPLYLRAAAHLELGKLLASRGELDEAVKELKASLVTFPEYVAAHYALAQALRNRATSEADMVEVEQQLQAAVEAAEKVASAEDCLLLSNRLCTADVELGDRTARSDLAMLLCQAGRDDEARPHLLEMGFRHRLARQVLHYPLDTCSSSRSSADQDGSSTAIATASSSSSCGGGAGDESARYVQGVDNALPGPLLDHMKRAFSPSSPFWREHHYGRVGYFSYMHPLDSPHTNSMHQLVSLVHSIVVKHFPQAAEARYAEWWAHCRRHPAGHQLHFDSDDEGVGGIRNPIITTVLFFEGGVGGPTLVTNQVMGGELADRGWLVYPRENRLVMFDGTFLHGVIPGRGPCPSLESRRTTLMIAFWKDIKCRPCEDGMPGSSQPFPGPDHRPPYSWPGLLQLQPGGWGSCPTQGVKPLPLPAVWEPVEKAPKKRAPATYTACFQGF